MSSQTKSQSGAMRWFTLFVLALSCGQIYQLPYLRYSYYDQMLSAFGVSNTELGMFMSLYGIGSIICYLLGGIVASKVSDKILLPSGMILTGLLGVWFAMFPPYGVVLVIHFLWAFTTSLVFWPSAINFIRGLGSSAEQGRLYGLFEGLRGITATLLGLVIVYLFSLATSEIDGLRNVIFVYSGIAVALGVLLFFIIPENGKEKKQLQEQIGSSSLLSGFGQALKLPITWIASGIVFCTMTTFICLGYTTPYLTACLGATAAFAATFATIRTYALQFVGGTFGGVLSDKIGSSSKTMIAGFAVIAIGFVALNLLPVNESMVWTASILILIFGVAIYVIRGVYFAVLDEANVPAGINAAVVGIVSCLGFCPEAFMYTIIGDILDKSLGAGGYQTIYWLAVVFAVIGLICAVLAIKVVKKNKEAKAAAAVAVDADAGVGNSTKQVA